MRGSSRSPAGPSGLPSSPVRWSRWRVAERIAVAAYPDYRHAVVALPDARRGERLVLVSEAPAVTRDALIEAAHREGLPEIAIPRDVVAVGQLPLLGSGKTNYPAVERLAAAEPGSPGAPADAVPAGLVAE